MANFATDHTRVENQTTDVRVASDAERERMLDEPGDGGARVGSWSTSARHAASVASRANHLVPELGSRQQPQLDALAVELMLHRAHALVQLIDAQQVV